MVPTMALVPKTPVSLVETGGALPPWPEVLDAFAGTLDSPRTRELYRRHVAAAFAWWRVGSPAELSGVALAAWRESLLADGRGPASHALALAAVRSFLRWSGTVAGAHAIPETVISAALKPPRVHVEKPFQTLTDPEIGAVLSAADTPRDRAILAVLLGAGLRVAELVALDVAHVREDAEGGAALYVSRGKGAKDRTVPVRPETVAAIRHYLAATGRTVASPGPLFRSHDRGAAKRDRARLSARSVDYLLRRVCKRAGVVGKTISPHSCRHTFAVRSLRTRRDPVSVAKLLGHRDLKTTARYLDHLALAELREAVPALPL